MGFVNPYSEINQNRLGHSKAGDLKRKKSIQITLYNFSGYFLKIFNRRHKEPCS